jgi:cysteine desulfurase family protein
MIYLDNSATTFPKPQISLGAVSRAITTFGGNPGRSGHSLCMKTSKKVFEIRSKLASFFNCSVENLIFTSNCTHSLNIAIKGTIKKGDHIIISDLEHNSVARPVFAMSKEGTSYDVARFIRGNTAQTISNFEALIKPNTRAIVTTHASNVTGDILPIREIGELCKRNGILFIVDGAQSAGIIPIDIRALNIDILCASGHKGMYGISGTGILAISDNIEIATIMQGGTGTDSFTLEQPDYYPEMLENGTINTVGVLSLEAGLEYISAKGIDTLYSYEMMLCQLLQIELEQNPNITIYSNAIINKSVPIVSFNYKGMTSMELASLLDKNKVCVRGGLHCSPLAHTKLNTLSSGIVRVSPSCFNIKSEIFYVAQVLKDIE